MLNNVEISTKNVLNNAENIDNKRVQTTFPPVEKLRFFRRGGRSFKRVEMLVFWLWLLKNEKTEHRGEGRRNEIFAPQIPDKKHVQRQQKIRQQTRLLSRISVSTNAFFVENFCVDERVFCREFLCRRTRSLSGIWRASISFGGIWPVAPGWWPLAGGLWHVQPPVDSFQMAASSQRPAPRLRRQRGAPPRKINNTAHTHAHPQPARRPPRTPPAPTNRPTIRQPDNPALPQQTHNTRPTNTPKQPNKQTPNKMSTSHTPCSKPRPIDAGRGRRASAARPNTSSTGTRGQPARTDPPRKPTPQRERPQPDVACSLVNTARETQTREQQTQTPDGNRTHDRAGAELRRAPRDSGGVHRAKNVLKNATPRAPVATSTSAPF